MIAWGDELVSAIARRRSVIMIGSGVSRNSTNADGKRPATWVDFLKSAAAKIDSPVIAELIDQRDYLTACELIKKKVGDDVFCKSGTGGISTTWISACPNSRAHI